MRHAVLLVLFLQSALSIQYSRKFFSNIIDQLEEPISSKCRQQIERFIRDLNGTSWSSQMVDSNSKVPKGLVQVKFEDLGDFDQCIATKTADIYGKYCLGFVSVDNTSLLLSDTFSFVAPVWALCLPDGCSTNDTTILGNAILTDLLEDDGVSVKFSDLLCQTVKDTQPVLTVPAIVAITVLSSLVLVVISASLYDIYCVYVSNCCPDVIKAYSLYGNDNIFELNQSKSNHLPCLDGLKFVSTMWVLIVHQYSVPMNGSTANVKALQQWPEKLYSMFILSGDISVDTFLIIGGTLMSYGFMRNRNKNLSFNLLRYYLHRYLRLTPTLAAVVLVSATLLTYMGSGPKWPIFTSSFQKTCEEYWWSTLLYVQNYVNPTKMCVAPSWYLNVDMQLYLVSPLIFYILWKYPKPGLVLLSLGCLSSMGTSFYEVWKYDLPGSSFGLYSTRFSDYQKYYYLVTHTRATPWIVGVILGYFLCKIKHKEISLRLNMYTVVCLWCLCFGTLLACVLGGHDLFLRQQYDTITNSIFASLVRPAWSVAISWVILACCLDYGGPVNWILSFPVYQVLNRFTYSIYLTHVTMLGGVAYSRRWPEYFSEFDRAYQFWGTLGFNAIIAILLVFFVECPVLVLEKMLFGNENDKRARTIELERERDVQNNGLQK